MVNPDTTVQVFEQTEMTLKGANRLGIDPVGRDMRNGLAPVKELYSLTNGQPLEQILGVNDRISWASNH